MFRRSPFLYTKDNNMTFKPRRIHLNETIEAYILIAPLIILLLVFIVNPIIMNFAYSFSEWKGFGDLKIVGFKNYIRIFHDVRFWVSIRNVFFLILYIPVGVFTALFLAATLREGLKGLSFFRTVLYLPNILGVVVLGTLYKLLFREYGPLNDMITSIFKTNPIKWLADTDFTIHVVSFLFVIFIPLGFRIIFFLSSMSGISNDHYDAAKIDGASWWQTFMKVTIPGIKHAIEFITVLAFIQVFARTFGFIYTITSGGPGFSTYTLEFGIYQLGFAKFQVGYASAWSSILAVLCGVVAYFQIRVIRKEGR